MRHIYAEKALSQIPRLLTLQDRNPYSSTYGCFKRTYWLDKTEDFPDSLPQFGVMSLALAYGTNIQGNLFYEQEKILEWTLAGMRYWTKLQHRDGSFDEFYPNEHGWTGPTGFLLYAMMRSFMVLDERGDFPQSFRDEFFTVSQKAADYIIKWDEKGVLANHHAIAVLPIYYAYHVLQDAALHEGYERKLADFLTFVRPEGWCLEYDGADVGYLSATVSFLGKVWKHNQDPRLLEVMQKATEFLQYFVYPNGYYAGSIGSRQTVHFYSHGCELLANTMPLAGRVASQMLQSIADGKLVPPEIMADRYFVYRIPEYLESYIDYSDERGDDVQLPYEKPDFRHVFPQGRFYIQKQADTYMVANAAKGGVTKVFSVQNARQLTSDSGIIARTTNGTVITSQWIDDEYTFEPFENGYQVSGNLHRVPAGKLFTPWKLIIFRMFLLAFGWHSRMAYHIKGLIRRLLMLNSGSVAVQFTRKVELCADHVRIQDTIVTSGTQLASVQLGDEFYVRYVPQSRYFQAQEFDTTGYQLSAEELQTLRQQGEVTVERRIPTVV